MRVPVVIACAWAVFLFGCGAELSSDLSQESTGAKRAGLPASSVKGSREGIPSSAAATPAKGAPAEALQRKIVYTAEVSLIVENFEPVPGKIDELLKEFGAVVAHSSVVGSPGMPRVGDWTIRVPVDRYTAFMAAARRLGEIRTVQSDSRDVTEEYYDVDARIRNKKEEEQRLLKLLDSAAGNLKNILEIEREVSRVREEVERMEGRMRVLNDVTSLSTVKLHIEEVKNYVPEKAPTFATRSHRVFSGSLEALVKAGQTLLLGLIGLAPWAGVVVLAGAPVVGVRLLLRGRKKPNGTA